VAQKWAEVDRQLRLAMPADFAAIDAFQKHVDTWTVCDQKTIAGMFEGLHTESERLAVLLGSPTVFSTDETRPSGGE
jgi:hypothetical protein